MTLITFQIIWNTLDKLEKQINVHIVNFAFTLQWTFIMCVKRDRDQLPYLRIFIPDFKNA